MISIARADGSFIERVEEDDAWIYDQMVQDGPDVQELVWDLNPKDDHWTAGGVGTVIPGQSKHDFRSVDINLQTAVNAPPPFIPEEHNPYTRSLSEDEQRAIMETVYDGVNELEDKLDERASDYEQPDLDRMQERLDTVNVLLQTTKEG